MHGQVIAIEQLTPRMVRLVLGGDGLEEFAPTEFTDQYVNVLFPPPGAAYTTPFDIDEIRALGPEQRPIGRRYTIRSWDPEQRLATIDFVVHGDVGTAGRWAGQACIGDTVQFTGPGGSYAPDPNADWHLMAGDETAIPAIAAALEQVPSGVPVIAVLLVDDPDHELALDCPGEIRVVWVHRSSAPADHELLPAAIAGLEFPNGRVHAFVHGEANETRAIREHLIGDRAIPIAHTSISPYWRRDFTDEAWREVKRDWFAAPQKAGNTKKNSAPSPKVLS